MRSLSLSILAILLAFASPRAETPTFSEHISPIIYNNCTSCHRSGEIGPMPLTNYSEIAAYADMIKYVTETQYMPPWKPDYNYSQHIGARTLTKTEINTISNWVNAGFPQGDIALEAPMPEFPTGSVLGTPDLVLTMAEPFTIRGDNVDQYQVFVIPTHLTEDREIEAVEFRPGNRRIVHHALIGADITGTARQRDLETPEEYGYESFGAFGAPTAVVLPGYTPGAKPSIYPKGVGHILPKNSDLLIQVHYAPWPLAESDQSSINIFFKKEPIEREVGFISMAPITTDGKTLSRILRVLLGDERHGGTPVEKIKIDDLFVIPKDQTKTFRTTLFIDRDISLLSIYPHMHLLGKYWEVYATDPQGNRTNLIRIEDWDFNWQGNYTFTRYQKIAAGSQIHAITTYDNTTNNPVNPNYPPRDLTWGEKTTDEMLLAVMEYVPYRPGDENIALTVGGGGQMSIDFNGNGQRDFADFLLFVQNFGLTRSDTSYQRHFDLNGDGHINFTDFIIFANQYAE